MDVSGAAGRTERPDRDVKTVKPSIAAALICALAVSVAGCSRTTTLCSSPEQSAACGAALGRAMAESGVSGLNVAIVDNFRLVDQWSAGQLARDDRRPVRSSTPFQAGDISQLVTSLGVMSWLQRYGGSLDIPVSSGLPRWSTAQGEQFHAQDITLRHLLTHSAGLLPTRYSGYAVGERLPTHRQIIDGSGFALNQAVTQESAPGTDCFRSAAGYELLGHWLEAQTSTHLTLWINRMVFSPLNIPARYRLIGLPPPAAGHDLSGNPMPGGHQRLANHASAGLWASATDLSGLMLELMAADRGLGRVITERSMARSMLTPGPCGRGLGLDIEQTAPETLVSLDGIAPGYRARLLGNIQRGSGVVVMTNSDRGHLLIDQIVEAVRQDYGW